MTPSAFLCKRTTCLRLSWSCSSDCFLAFSFSITIGARKRRKVHILLGRINIFEASLPGNTSKELPENLVWYPHEPTWASVANGRLRFGLKEFSLTVNYDDDDDYRINGTLNAAATKAGLELGGKFENHVATSWKLVGTFASQS